MNRHALAWLTAALTVTAAAPVGTQMASWPSERPPEPLAVREMPFPDYDIRTLANGLRVVAVPHHEQPAVSLRLLIGAGTAHDPIDKPGVANLMALVLDQGTDKLLFLGEKQGDSELAGHSVLRRSSASVFGSGATNSCSTSRRCPSAESTRRNEPSCAMPRLSRRATVATDTVARSASSACVQERARRACRTRFAMRDAASGTVSRRCSTL